MIFGQSPTTVLFLVPAVLYAIVFHEVAHGVVARHLGDPTAQRAGRLTLNPLPHIDWLGAIALLLVGFGWAKPVPVDPRYFRHPYRDTVLVALAGPASNMLLAAALAGLLRLLLLTPWAQSPFTQVTVAEGMVLSINLGLFNLLPIPPLDGSRLLFGLSGGRLPRLYLLLERFGFVILIVLLYAGVVTSVLVPIDLAVVRTLLGWVGVPFGGLG